MSSVNAKYSPIMASVSGFGIFSQVFSSS